MVVALLAEGVDRNCGFCGCLNAPARSPSSRRAWIEIYWLYTLGRLSSVALLAEGVDRNAGICKSRREVYWSPSSRRAWIEIRSVHNICSQRTSPSSRRAWIEMIYSRFDELPEEVALLAEGVDRNFLPVASHAASFWSPSSRRAWIEMQVRLLLSLRSPASPSSRRAWIEISPAFMALYAVCGRPPRGGRG